MRTLAKTVYHFDELTESAKENARDWWKRCEDQDLDIDYDNFERMGALLGIEIDQRAVKLMGGGTRYEPTIFWSGFSSQGDGACFEGRYRYAKGAAKAIAKETGGTEHALIKIAERLAAAQKPNCYRLEAIVKQRGNYSHAYSMEIDVFDREDNCRIIDGDDIGECLRDFANWIYRQIEAEYEYRMSDENVDENVRINEYEFDENGHIN
jgi:hypothetical protein